MAKQVENREASLQLIGNDILNSLLKQCPQAVPLVPAIMIMQKSGDKCVVSLVLRSKHPVFQMDATFQMLEQSGARHHIIKTMRGVLDSLALAWGLGYRDGQNIIASRLTDWLTEVGKQAEPDAKINLKEGAIRAAEKSVAKKLRKLVTKEGKPEEVKRD